MVSNAQVSAMLAQLAESQKATNDLLAKLADRPIDAAAAVVSTPKTRTVETVQPKRATMAYDAKTGELVLRVPIKARGARSKNDGRYEFVCQSTERAKTIYFTIDDNNAIHIDPRSKGMVTQYAANFNFMALVDPMTGNRIDGVK